MDEFTDKVAVVTGGGSGIGEALCRELARRGARVTTADIDEGRCERTAAGVAADGGRIDAVCVDVSSESGVRELLMRCRETHGRLDYVFNNAGIAVCGDARDLTLDDWRAVIDVDQWGVIYGTLAAYQIMADQGYGHIVNTASLAGLTPYPTNAPYSTAKHAVVGFSLSLRSEGEPLGVKVSAVCPGYVLTDIYRATKVVNAEVDPDELVASLPFKVMEADRAAKAILRGVSRNRAIIVFPTHAQVLWRLHRLYPSLLAPLGRKMVRDFGKLRMEQARARVDSGARMTRPVA